MDGQLTDPGAGEGFEDDDLDLTPRTSERRPPRGAPRWPAVALVVVLLVGIGFLMTKMLGEATLYFRNADEAVAQRDELGTRRFRLQGLVTEEPQQVGDTVAFTVTFNAVDVAVVHRGDPPDLFQPGLPVVLEGHFDERGATFLSDRILVKHSEEYEADNGERIRDATDGEGSP